MSVVSFIIAVGLLIQLPAVQTFIADKLMEKLDRRAGAVGFAVYLDLLEQMPGEDEEYDVDVLLIYEEDTEKAAVAKAVSALTSVGKTVSAQKSIPQKLRYRKLMKLSKEGALC